MENNSGIKKEYGKISVDKVEAHQFKAGVDQAQIRQIVTKIYPGSSVGNNKSDSLFGIDEFELEGGKEYTSTRVTWIDVPKGTAQAKVESMLANLPDACIYQEVSDSPILTDNQESALESGLTTLDVFEKAQLVRDEKGNEILDDAGNLIYTAKFFSKTAREDVDHRSPAKDSAISLSALAADEDDMS